ncbi:GNAT family N-acetyltransferase [Phenylobacterium sp.]|uniref:GNAT family N-acetyltransferase n=1 Tax=Phenylobacterium sp. TaxID=1871053 RepID=UPI0025D22737|nr:GNAT family N-acetyltransferase [Phenylobacterium sp.]
MGPADIESLERATVEGVAPAKVVEIGGWLVPLDDGAIGRAKSAVPLRHDLDAAAIGDIEAAYWTEGLSPAFRVAEGPGLQAVREALARRAYVGGKPTVVKVGDVARLASLRDTPGEILAEPDAAWGAVFLGEGFDPEDGASRVAALSRSPDAIYGLAKEDGRTVAVGVATFGHGWAGIHGMRTEARRRGRGLASTVLAALGRAIQARGVERVFLQVEEANDARSLYRKAGFQEAWRYRYWTR